MDERFVRTTAHEGRICCIGVSLSGWAVVDWESPESHIKTASVHSPSRCNSDDLCLDQSYHIGTLLTSGKLPVRFGSVPEMGALYYSRNLIGDIVTPEEALDSVLGRASQPHFPASMVFRAGMACHYPAVVQAVGETGYDSSMIPPHKLLEYGCSGLLIRKQSPLEGNVWGTVPECKFNFYIPDTGEWESALSAAVASRTCSSPTIRRGYGRHQ